MKRIFTNRIVILLLLIVGGGLTLVGCNTPPAPKAQSLQGVWGLRQVAVGDAVTDISGILSSMLEVNDMQLSNFLLDADGSVFAVGSQGERLQDSRFVWKQHADTLVISLKPGEAENGDLHLSINQTKMLVDGLVFIQKDGKLWFDATAILNKMAGNLRENMESMAEGGEISVACMSLSFWSSALNLIGDQEVLLIFHRQ